MPKKKQEKARKKRPPKTVKEKQFVKGILEGKTATAAARAAGYSDAGQSGYELSKRLDIESVLENAGLTDDYLAKVLLEASDAKTMMANKFFIDLVPDWNARLRAVQMIMELKNRFPAKKIEAAVGGQEMIEQWKKEMGIDGESLSGLREVAVGDTPPAAIPLSEEDDADASEGDTVRPTEGPVAGNSN